LALFKSIEIPVESDTKDCAFISVEEKTEMHKAKKNE
jgi:hypothetical protein